MKSITGKLLALFLALTLAAGLAPVRVSAAGEASSFPDVTDATVGEAVEILRTMGIVNGAEDGKYHPENSLTRAEFCKMAVLVMGEGGSVGAYETRTIFPDVTAACWARGYINYASQRNIGTGEEDRRLVNGKSDGLFWPNDPISFDEAFTILLRVLGYGAEADSNWPLSARAQAIKLGLTADMGTFDGGKAIDRGSAAVLFRNMLMTAPNGKDTAYITEKGTLTEDVIYYEVEDGEAKFILPREGEKEPEISSLKPAVAVPGAFLLGRRGTAVKDAEGKLAAFLPEDGVACRTVVIRSVTATAITATDGSRFSVPTGTKVFRNGISYTFGEGYRGLDVPGLSITVCYTSSGDVDYLFTAATGSASGRAAVAEKDGSGAFDSLTGGAANCRVVKNGAAVPYSAVKKYDVGVYDKSSNTVFVSDFRLTGLFESAKPNRFAPSTIEILGQKTDFDVLDCAIPDFENVQPGDVATFLFAPDGSVAGVRPQSEVSGNAIGLVLSSSSGSEARIELINTPIAFDRETGGSSTENGAASGAAADEDDRVILEGELMYANASSYVGQIVSVNGSTRKRDGKAVPVLTVARVQNAVTGELDVKDRTVGGREISESAVIYEKVGKSDLFPAYLPDVLSETVPASQVLFTHLNDVGKVDILILDDVTGDVYTYGLVTQEKVITEKYTVFGPIKNNATIVTYGNGENDKAVAVGTYGTVGEFGGLAVSMDKLGDVNRCAGYAKLSALRSAGQSCFDLSTYTFTKGAVKLPIAKDVRLYDGSAGEWSAYDPEKFLLFTNSFTVYYDRTPETGGKVRIIVAE